jgi:iron complex transport system ATP-binding protein
MIHIDNISAGYLNKKILNCVSCRIHKGDFFGIVGKNGVGKSTLLKTICKLINPYSGNIFINNKNINSFSNVKFARLISFLSQNEDTTVAFNVFKFIMLGRYPYMNIFKFFSSEDKIITKKIMNFLNISDLSKKKINELSNGEKQKVLIAQTLVQETDIILFDEPISYLDFDSQNCILKKLKSLSKNYNKTIILTLHDLSSAFKFCNRLALLDNCSIYNYEKSDVDVQNYINTQKNSRLSYSDLNKFDVKIHKN